MNSRTPAPSACAEIPALPLCGSVEARGHGTSSASNLDRVKMTGWTQELRHFAFLVQPVQPVQPLINISGKKRSPPAGLSERLRHLGRLRGSRQKLGQVGRLGLTQQRSPFLTSILRRKRWTALGCGWTERRRLPTRRSLRRRQPRRACPCPVQDKGLHDAAMVPRRAIRHETGNA